MASKSFHLLMKAIFRMGIPVSPRNIFPSNIQGAPTWYEVRVSEKGYLGRRGGQAELMVSVNPQSMTKDVEEVCPGGYFFYDNTYPLDFKLIRDDIHYIGLPLTQITSWIHNPALVICRPPWTRGAEQNDHRGPAFCAR